MLNIKFQSLINLSCGLKNKEQIKSDDYVNFNKIENNAILLIDNSFTELVNELIPIKTNLFVVNVVPTDNMLEKLVNILKNWKNYSQVKNGEDLNVYFIGSALFEVYQHLITEVHITSMENNYSLEANSFWNKLSELKYSRVIYKFINETGEKESNKSYVYLVRDLKENSKQITIAG